MGIVIRLRVIAAALFAGLVAVQPASAKQDDGVIEHMSGPGPFIRFPSLDIRVLCVTHVGGTTVDPDAGHNETVGLTPWSRGSTAEFGAMSPGTSASQARIQCANDDKVRGYVTVAYGHYSSLENNLFPNNLTDDQFKVKAESLSVRFMGRTIRDVVDVGFGLNFFWFHGEAFETFARASVEPFRISVAPLAALKSTPRTRAFHVGVAPTIFIGKMDQDDFCNTSGCTAVPRPFSTRGEILWATSVEVDVFTLIKGK
jgi:hypothetical protein